MRHGLRDLDGRALAGAIVAVFFIALGSIDSASGSAHWMKLGVDAYGTRFEDMRSVTSSWDCERRGIEAFPNNPCDPLGRPANYPRILTRLGFFGLGEGDTVELGVATAVVFFLAALLVTGPLGLGEGLLYAATLLSPAVLLGVERGNVDLIMFALVALGVALVGRSPWLGGAPIALAGVLKLFPTFGLAMLARRRARWAAGAVWLVALAVYAAVTLDDIRALLRVLPREVKNSYGALVIADALQQAGVSWARTGAEVRAIRFGVIAAGVLVAAGLVALRRGGRGRLAARDERRLDAFWAGASIYIGTYVFSTNFDYRLIFLLLCVPQLCAWHRDGTAPAPWPAAVLVALLATLWLSSTSPPLLPFGLQSWYLGLSFPPEEALNWLLFAWFTAALVSGLLELRERRLAA
jgi:hypothetical protein